MISFLVLVMVLLMRGFDGFLDGVCRSKASSMKYNFPHKEGTGIRPLIPHVSAECVDLINQLLAYDPDER